MVYTASNCLKIDFVVILRYRSDRVLIFFQAWIYRLGFNVYNLICRCITVQLYGWPGSIIERVRPDAKIAVCTYVCSIGTGSQGSYAQARENIPSSVDLCTHSRIHKFSLLWHGQLNDIHVIRIDITCISNDHIAIVSSWSSRSVTGNECGSNCQISTTD